MRDLLLDHDLGERRRAHEVEVVDQTHAGLLEVVVEHHVVDVPERIEVAEPSIHGDPQDPVAGQGVH